MLSMGIKGFRSFLENVNLAEVDIIYNTQNKDDEKRNLILLDAPGFIERLYRTYERTVSLLFDFNPLLEECKKMKRLFEKIGFKLVIFCDGYFIKDKLKEYKVRFKKHRREKPKKIEILRQLHQNNMTKNERDKLERKFRWCCSAGYSEYLVQALTDVGFEVHRGSGTIDIDHDIAQYALLHQERVYGIASDDTDFFGFDIPEHIKIINKWTFDSEHCLKFHYYEPCKAWKYLNLSVADRYQLIRICGNDFYKPREKLLKRLQENEPDPFKTTIEIVADAINEKQFSHIKIPKIITDFYMVKDDENTEWTKLAKLNINIRYSDLTKLDTFKSGLFFHDVHSFGSTIHQKLAPLRHAIYNELHCEPDKVVEYVPVLANDNKIEFDGISIDYKQFKTQQTFLLDADESGRANADKLVNKTLMYLEENMMVNERQIIALKLQYFGRQQLISNVQQFEQFKRSGMPMVEDLSAMWLYLECARLLTLNQYNITPFVGHLFDGPLYHFLLFEQRNGDKQKIIESLWRALDYTDSNPNDNGSQCVII